MESREEVYDLPEKGKFCPCCGLPFTEMPNTDDTELIEVQEVRGYRRIIQRKKYISVCRCPGTTGIITAPGPAKLLPGSRYGTSLWIHLLLRKFRFQVPIARTLKQLSLNGLSIPAGSVGGGLKRLAPLFDPIYAALLTRQVNKRKILIRRGV